MKNHNHPSEARDWYVKGRHLMRDNQYRQALVAFGKTIEHDTAYAPAYFYRGVCYYLIGNYALSNNDMEAAAILGYRDAQLWSKFEMKDDVKRVAD